MRCRLALCALLLLAAADPRPGWLGFGFLYHHPVPPAAGWMFVQAVAPNSPSAKAGLKAQDVITHVNRAPLRFATDEELLLAMAKVRPGERVTFRVRRGAATTDVVVKAGVMSDEMWRLWKRNQAMAKRP